MKKHILFSVIAIFVLMILPLTIVAATLPAPVMTEDVETAIGGPGITDPNSPTNPFVNCKIFYGNPNSYLLAGVAQKSNSSLAKYVINGNQSVYCDNLGETALEYNQFAVTNDSTAGFLDNTTYVATMLFKDVTPLASDGNLYFTLRTWIEKDKPYYPTFKVGPNPDKPGEFSTAVENSKSLLNKISVKKLSADLICVAIRFQTSTCSDPNFKDKWMFFFGVKNQTQVALDDFKLFKSTSDPTNFFQTAAGVMEKETASSSTASSSATSSATSSSAASSTVISNTSSSTGGSSSAGSSTLSDGISSDATSGSSGSTGSQDSVISSDQSGDSSVISNSGDNSSEDTSSAVSTGSTDGKNPNTGIIIAIVIAAVVLVAGGITFYLFINKKKV
ncbi:MAG: hypothetical protein ACYC5K_12720 [Saccharofermentanales bacterium]